MHTADSGDEQCSLCVYSVLLRLALGYDLTRVQQAAQVISNIGLRLIRVKLRQIEIYVKLRQYIISTATLFPLHAIIYELKTLSV